MITRPAELIHRALVLAQRRGYQVSKPVSRVIDLYDEPTARVIADVAPFTMTPPARIAVLLDAVDYVVRARIPGAIVECGVWRGGSAMAAATRLSVLAADDRELWLYDTFAAGMSEPTANDVTYSAVPRASGSTRTVG